MLCLEGRSWRKDYYEPYKRNRAQARAALTEREQQEDLTFWDAFDELKTFWRRTNCTVLQDGQCEADDFIARWIQNHPMISIVLLAVTVTFIVACNQCKPVQWYYGTQLITLEGIFDDKGKLCWIRKLRSLKVPVTHNGCCLRSVSLVILAITSL